jgi:hypothetical protein
LVGSHDGGDTKDVGIGINASSSVMGNEEKGKLPFLQHGKVLLRHPLDKITVEKRDERREGMNKHLKRRR